MLIGVERHESGHFACRSYFTFQAIGKIEENTLCARLSHRSRCDTLQVNMAAHDIPTGTTHIPMNIGGFPMAGAAPAVPMARRLPRHGSGAASERDDYETVTNRSQRSPSRARSTSEARPQAETYEVGSRERARSAQDEGQSTSGGYKPGRMTETFHPVSEVRELDRMTQMEQNMVRLLKQIGSYAASIIEIKQELVVTRADFSAFKTQAESDITGLLERNTFTDNRLDTDESRIKVRMREMGMMINELRDRPPAGAASAPPVYHQIASSFGAPSATHTATMQPDAEKPSPFGGQPVQRPPSHSSADSIKPRVANQSVDPLFGAGDPWTHDSTPQFARTPEPTNGAPHTLPTTALAPPSSWNASAPQPSGQGGGYNGGTKSWDISKNISREVTPFKGVSLYYKTWHHRMRNNWVRDNPDYAPLLKLIEAEESPLKWEKLKSGIQISGKQVDLIHVATQMWSSIADHLDDTIFDRMSQMVSGEDENGIEMWRKLFRDHEGGGEQVKAAGLTNLHNFPKCESPANVIPWMSEWNACAMLHSDGLSESHQKVMFVNKLPDSIATDIRKQPQLRTLQGIMDWLSADGARLNDHRLVTLHEQRIKQNLSNGKGMVSAVTEEAKPARDRFDALEEKFDRLVNAIGDSRNGGGSRDGNGRGRAPSPGSRYGKGDTRKPRSESPSPRPNNGNRPSPDFKGKTGARACWECGKEGCTRATCPVYKELLAKNGGRRPDGHRGAFEKSAKPATGTAAALLNLGGDDSESDFSETQFDMAFGLGNEGAFKFMNKSFKPQCRSTECDGCVQHPNTFDVLRDDEDDVVNALQNLTSNIKIGPKVPQSQRRKPKPLTHARIAAIVNQVKSGQIQLGELDMHCDNDEDMIAVWALIDSGSSINVADQALHFPGCKVRKSKTPGAKYTAANNSEMNNLGEFDVKATTMEGSKAKITFQYAKVGMPILSVAKLAEDHDATFGEESGELIHRKTAVRTKFVKRAGVYFMQLMVSRKSLGLPVDEGCRSCTPPFGGQDS